MTSNQTVFVVDDSPGMREAVSSFLLANGMSVKTFGSAKEFLAAYDGSSGGCLILDIRMPEMSGVELQEHLLAQGVTLPIIIVSGHAAITDAVKAMKLGSFEFMEKPYSPDILLRRVREALEHDRKIRTENALLTQFKSRYLRLTEREKQILALVVAGKQSKIIADRMGLSVSTIDNHRANIMNKLHAETSADLVRIALLADPDLAFPSDE